MIQATDARVGDLDLLRRVREIGAMMQSNRAENGKRPGVVLTGTLAASAQSSRTAFANLAVGRKATGDKDFPIP